MKRKDAGFGEWLTDRWFEFRVGDITYLRFIVNFTQFLIIAYTLYIPRLTWLEAFFSSILLFGFTFIVIYIPLAVILGRFVHRKRQLRKDLMIGTAENPMAAWINRVSFEQTITICKYLNIPISEEYQEVYKFWKKLDEKMNWRPDNKVEANEED